MTHVLLSTILDDSVTLNCHSAKWHFFLFFKKEII